MLYDVCEYHSNYVQLERRGQLPQQGQGFLSMICRQLMRWTIAGLLRHGLLPLEIPCTFPRLELTDC
jgi:hypothetical protein